MKYLLTKPEKLGQTVVLPASKSISNRALILHALSGADNQSLHNVSNCDDTFVMRRALDLLGAEHATAVKPGADTTVPTIDIMAAGTSMRFLTALLSATPGCHIITGSERMHHRPIGVLTDALRRLGASISYEADEGFPPLRIEGRKLRGGRLDIPGSISSQYISALLMIAPLMAEGLELHLTGQVISRPYIRMTVEMMRQYGADIRWSGNRTLHIAPRPYTPVPYYIEADWTAASYWFEMIALRQQPTDKIVLPQLFSRSLQGDAEVRHVFRLLGVRSWFGTTASGETALHLGYSPTPCTRLDYDFSRIPDLAQTVVVTCALRGIPFRLTGLQTLKIKETDRIEALRTELRKWGINIEAEDDSILYWDGPALQRQGDIAYLKPAAGTAIDTYDDHRMAMSFAPAAVCIDGVTINNPEVVSKSYPHYWDDLRAVGFGISE